jgi:hypothetical protein
MASNGLIDAIHAKPLELAACPQRLPQQAQRPAGASQLPATNKP